MPEYENVSVRVDNPTLRESMEMSTKELRFYVRLSLYTALREVESKFRKGLYTREEFLAHLLERCDYAYDFLGPADRHAIKQQMLTILTMLKP